MMNSPISRMGGKKLLRKEILSRFPEQRPDKYVEVFGGAGWVLFASDQHAETEIFNDADKNLINLFRCVKYHTHELQKEIRWLINAREQFEDCKAQLTCQGFTDIQRAAQYYVQVKLSYGADARTYGGKISNLTKARTFLTEVQKRLEHVRIECKSFEKLIPIHDAAGTLFYLDPPYVGTEDCYAIPFGYDEHISLRNLLSGIQGKFILSYGDHPIVRELYKDFRIDEVERSSNLTGRYKDAPKKFRELIIRNY